MKKLILGITLAATLLAPTYATSVFASTNEQSASEATIISEDQKVYKLESGTLEEQKEWAEESERKFREHPRVFNKDIEKYIKDPELLKKAKAVSETENKQNPIQIQSVSKDELEKVTAAGTIFLPYQFTFSIKVSTNPDTAQRFAPGASTLVIYSNATSYESSPSNTYWIDVFKVGSSSPIGRAYFTRNNGTELQYVSGLQPGSTYYIVVGKANDGVTLDGYGTLKNPG
ncbi:hypothetical protein [Aneurinibacillus sp. UBA3580]|jgi:hypothetical protein|uniref:hypothetical protein n=1 Tax=Aneurinibacillus sp. UBA3580 TaxID=1946041 RepID=UPI00257FBB96|nr:hypothetical protein [Aneurinibacillus sp. UBA3580]